MIQRIQTLYLLITMICLSVVQFGADIFYLIGEKMYALNAYGIMNSTPGQDEKMAKSIPLFLPVILLTVLIVVCIMSYKNLKKQLLLVKIIGLVYLLLTSFLTIILFSNFNLIEEEAQISYKISTGFLFMIIGIPSIFLAHKGIKKDLNLLDSLNRLR
jgi:hypothetical protein